MPGEITRLLTAWRRGDPEALRQLFPLVYDELKGVARRQLRKPGRDATLDTTALVHETYLKLAGGPGASLNDREHFFAVAAWAMRQILVDLARRRLAAKRGGNEPRKRRSELERDVPALPDRLTELLVIDEALRRLEEVEPRLTRVVELRVFGGLSVEESARILDVSEATVKREWRKARAILSLALGRDHQA